jgi:hypothetical protein
MIKLKELARRVYGGEDRALKLLLTAAVLCWLPRVFTPLWRDEVITWWIIKDGWGDALRLPSLAACRVRPRRPYFSAGLLRFRRRAEGRRGRAYGGFARRARRCKICPLTLRRAAVKL